MKNFRMHLGAAALVASAVLAGCGGRDDGGNNGGSNEDAGCTGVCNSDAGSDGGTTNPEPDGGTTEPETDGGTTEPDGGTTEPVTCPEPSSEGLGPIAQLKIDSGEGQRHVLNGLVVTAIDYPSFVPDAGFAQTTQFWAASPCFPNEGIYIDRYWNNPNAGDYFPRVGDVISVDGLFRHYSASGAATPTNIVSYRPVLKDSYGLEGASGSITVSKTGEVAPLPDNEVPAGFGNSQGGTVKANPEFEGARVFIPGPITISNARPLALKSRPYDPENDFYNGFELEGGILVSNNRTYSKCDYRRIVADGGTVTFPNGVRGVWDTYTNVQCAELGTNADGGTTCVKYANGGIPGTLEDGGVGMVTDYTYVLYPLNCDVDLVGEEVAGEVDAGEEEPGEEGAGE